MRERFSIERMVDEVDAVYAEILAAMKVLHMTKVQGHRRRRAAPARAPARRCASAGVDARFLSLDAGGDAARFHRALDERGDPVDGGFRAGSTSRRASPPTVTSRVRAERPDLLHTHMVHADVYGSLAAHLSRTPFVSTRHNDDRYLLGPFRHVDRAFMRGAQAHRRDLRRGARTSTSRRARRRRSS